MSLLHSSFVSLHRGCGGIANRPADDQYATRLASRTWQFRFHWAIII